MPPEFSAESQEQIARSLFLTSELEKLLHRFQRAEVEVISLKGPALAQTLYSGVGVRSSDDLDFLVHRGDFGWAEAQLLQSGFSPAGPADDYHRGYERDGVFVELHFRISSSSAPHFDLTAAWSRARIINFRSAETRIFSAVDRVLYLALHGLKHRFGCLIWVIDFLRAIQALKPSDEACLLQEARAQGLGNIVLASCEVARSMFQIDLPPEVADELSANPALAADARSMAGEILAGVANPATLPEDARDYLTFADPGRRWRQRLKFLLPTYQDYRWAASHGFGRACVPLIRPFRLARKYGVASSVRLLFPRP